MSSKPRGVLNKNAFTQLQNAFSGSGTLRMREPTPGTFIFDTNAPAVQLQKSLANVAGAGRLIIGAGETYIPEYTLGIGAAPGSGWTATEDGVYFVEASVAVSGVANAIFTGDILVDGVATSGNASCYPGGGGAVVNVHGFVHATLGQVINVGISSVFGAITTLGAEELVNAPAATLTILKVPSDELSQSGS